MERRPPSLPTSPGDGRASGPAPTDRDEPYRLLVDDLTEYAIAVLDTDGRVLSWNRGAERMTGYSTDEVLGRHVARFCMEARPERMLEERTRVARDRGRFEVERWCVRRDGTRFWVHELMIPLRDDRRRVVGYGAISRDRTADKRRADMQRLLAEAGAVLASSLDYGATLRTVARLCVPALADWCVIGLLEEDGAIRTMEVAASSAEKRAALRELVRRYPRWPRDPDHPVDRALRTGEAQMLPRVTDELIDLLTSDEASRAALVRELAPRSIVIAPMVARGRTLGIISMAMAAESGRHYGDTDVAPIAQLARRAAVAVNNARLYREAQEAIRLRDETHRIVAHDLRSPLNAINTALQMLRESPASGPDNDDVAKQSIDIALRAATQMDRLIGDMLEIGRIEGKGMRLECASERVDALIDDAVRMHREVAADRSIELRVELAPELPPVQVDRDRILQVFSNLIDNALKFTPPGGSVIVGAEPGGSDVRCRVADTGPGIPERERAHLFERFWQARRSRRAGAGLGLAICKGIIEAHDGRLWVRSQIGEGSTFFFTLPSRR